jgi:hypothetical protein
MTSDDRAPSPLTRPLPNSYWVIHGRFLAGEHPTGANEDESVMRVQSLCAAGISCFVDLTEEGERPGYQHMLAGQTEYVRSSIVDSRVPLNVSQTLEVLAVIQQALARGGSVYVHCRAGIGRTGLVVGCFLAEEQGRGQAALKRLNMLWSQSEMSKSWREIPQTYEQAAYVRNWPRLRRLAPR